VLGNRDVAGSDLVFVGGEGSQDFGLLALRDLDEVQSPSECSAAISSNSAGEMWRSRWASSRPSGVVPGLVAVN